MPISGRFYTSEELQELLSVKKQRIANLAKEQGWGSSHPGLYDAYDVDEYLWARARAQLYREFGVSVKGLIKDDSFDKDDNCPECGAFASYNPNDESEWRCIKGHSGKVNHS